jgi:hypothetical protein
MNIGMWGIPENNYQKLAQQCKLDHSNMLPAHEMTKCLFYQMFILPNIYFTKLFILPNFTLFKMKYSPLHLHQHSGAICTRDNSDKYQ